MALLVREEVRYFLLIQCHSCMTAGLHSCMTDGRGHAHLDVRTSMFMVHAPCTGNLMYTLKTW